MHVTRVFVDFQQSVILTVTMEYAQVLSSAHVIQDTWEIDAD